MAPLPPALPAASPFATPQKSQSDTSLSLNNDNNRSSHDHDHDDKHKKSWWTELQRKVPALQHATNSLRSVPPKWRVACIFCWVAWKFLAAFLVVYFLQQHATTKTITAVVSTSTTTATTSTTAEHQNEYPTRILYIVTSLAEFDNGRRSTAKGKDRLGTVLLPVLADSVQSLAAVPDYQVDVYLILAYTLTEPSRLQLIRDSLPDSVGLEIWDDACPVGYDRKGAFGTTKIQNNTRSLARQHRYVIKDKLPYYDLILAWEDDMRITAAHVQTFLEQSAALDVMRQQADAAAVPETAASESVSENMDPLHMTFYGDMTRRQLDRLIPGFVRVEVLLNETQNGAQTAADLDPIPLDYEHGRHFDPVPCCHVNMHPNVETPVQPASDQVVIWETNIKGLSVRQLPKTTTLETKPSVLDWVVLLPGPGKRMKAEELMGGYWSGRDGDFGEEPKPSPGMPDLIAQQGGWMATRQQLMRLHTDLCQGAFVPPFDSPIYRKDGQESMNVEFYSGGYQFFTGVLGGCNMQRVVSMDPEHFSKHFIYHVANNKQRQLARRRMVRADHLLGQLNTVKKRAEKSKATLL